jgi:hypothetical protein
MRRALIPLCIVLGVAGCGSSHETGGSSSADAPPPTISTSTTPPATLAHHAGRHTRPRRRIKSRRAPSPSGLVYSTTSAHRVQPQPAPGSCHATGHGSYSSPDRHCTPGALNPAVTQSTIDHTICVAGYTKTIRPPESVTEPEKLANMAAYGVGGRSAHDFEYDHLVSLELGGAVNDPRNLWPEPGASPNPKDSVEDRLHDLVCDGQMPLATAQHVIATDWVNYSRANHPAPTTPSPSPTAPPPSSSSRPNKPISAVNCSDFSTHAAAQRWFNAHGGSASNDVAGLDGNHNGIACESLP